MWKNKHARYCTEYCMPAYTNVQRVSRRDTETERQEKSRVDNNIYMRNNMESLSTSVTLEIYVGVEFDKCTSAGMCVYNIVYEGRYR